MPLYVAVTGCCGFIGRSVARKLLARGDYVYGVDALTYAADPSCVETFEREHPGHFEFRPFDVRSLGRLPDVDAVIHLAAETHVDNSLLEAAHFVDVNVGATRYLLDLIVAKRQHGMPHLIHVSTDEVYGPMQAGEKAYVDSALHPSSPYAASKAAADLLVRAWGNSYGLPYTIVRPTNCYGVGQYPEKLIPKAVRSVMLGRPIPVHGDGSMTRQWLAVWDAASAIVHAMDQRGALPSIVNVGGNAERSVAYVVGTVIRELGRGEAQLGFAREGADARYEVDDLPLRVSGWEPNGAFDTDLPVIVQAEVRAFRF